MKPVLVGAVIACALIALVLLMFPPGAEETPFGSGIETAETSLEDPGEIPVTQRLRTPGTVLRTMIFLVGNAGGIGPPAPAGSVRGGGVDVPQGASTEELMELMAELIGDGFIGFVP
jgi:hypothetical protein